MMPSAKVVICDRLFPENMSYSPSMPPCARAISSRSASGLMPGVGMWPPTRYTASKPSGNHRRLRDVAAREDLDLALAADEPALAQQLGGDFGARIEACRQRVEVHHLVLDAKRVVEPALRHAAVQRHLAALEPALVLEARARLRPLVAAAGLRALAGALTTADALLPVLGALGRLEITEIHDARPLFLNRHQVTDLGG